MGLHHRDYREVQRSQIHTHKSRTNHPLWCGERIVNTDKAGRPRRTRNLEHSLAAQPIQKTSHARKPCVTHSRPRTKRRTAFTAVEESRSRTPQYTEVEWASQQRTSSSASTWAWTSRIQRRSKYRTPSLHPQTYWHFVWHSSFFTSEAISFFLCFFFFSHFSVWLHSLHFPSDGIGDRSFVPLLERVIVRATSHFDTGEHIERHRCTWTLGNQRALCTHSFGCLDVLHTFYRRGRGVSCFRRRRKKMLAIPMRLPGFWREHACLPEALRKTRLVRDPWRQMRFEISDWKDHPESGQLICTSSLADK